MSGFSRRAFVLGAAAMLTAGGLPGCAAHARRRDILLSAFEDLHGDQYVGGISLEDSRVFGARVPMRAHGCAPDPVDMQRALFFARRPGTQAFELRRDTMQVRSVFATAPGRHLSGHGVFSSDGELLFVAEHDYERARGIITVRETRRFSVVREIDTHGIDPHELAWLPDGRRLLIANGGIMTHPRSFRRKLNIATMDPSLCVVDAHTGERLEQWRLPDHLLSIRHLAMAADGSAAIGLQYEGEPSKAPAVAAIYRPGHGLQLLQSPGVAGRKFHGYVASVALSEAHDLIAAACPYGNGVACWTLREPRYRGFIAAAESYGLSRLADGAVMASQRDGTAACLDESRLRSQFVKPMSAMPIRWDDHWVAIG